MQVFLPFVCKGATVKLCYLCEALTQSVRRLHDDSFVPSTSKFSCSKIKVPQLIASQF